MKTKELIEQINKSPYIRVHEDTYNLNFHTETSDLCFYILSKYSMEISQATTLTSNMSGITLHDIAEMIILLTEWLETSYEDRKEEKRYYLRCKFPPLVQKPWCHTLNLNKHTNKYLLGTEMETEDYKTIFTESEIAEMDITGFTKEEVE